jgi:DNA-binding NarL/FixJ family response regulator
MTKYGSGSGVGQFSREPSSSSPQGLRVLLVDDNEAMLARARAVLMSSCVVVGMVKDGPAALQQAIDLQPDVIVLDISMPGMTGLEVAVRLRAAGSTAAVVFLTVHDDDDFVAAARAAGGMGYVVKPRLVSDLPLAVQEARAGRHFVSVGARQPDSLN